MSILSERLRQIRIEKQLTQADVANQLGIARHSIQRFEYGTINPSIDNLIKLCQIYNISADWLLGITEKQTPLDSKDDQQEYIVSVIEKLNMASGYLGGLINPEPSLIGAPGQKISYDK